MTYKGKQEKMFINSLLSHIELKPTNTCKVLFFNRLYFKQLTVYSLVSVGIVKLRGSTCFAKH